MSNRFVASFHEWNNPNPRQLEWIGYLFFAVFLGVAWSTPQIELASEATGFPPVMIIGTGVAGLAFMFRRTRWLHETLFRRSLYSDEMYTSLDRVGRNMLTLRQVVGQFIKANPVAALLFLAGLVVRVISQRK